MADQPNPPAPAPFNPQAPHHTRPKARALRGIPVEAQDPQGNKHQMLGIADQKQISEKMVVVPPAAQMVIPLMDGTRDIPQIVTQVGRGLTAEILQNMVAQLDDAGLLEGPVFQALLAKSRAEFDQSDILPPGATSQFAEMIAGQTLGENSTEAQRAELAPKKLREVFDKWMSEVLKSAEKPSFDQLPKAVVAPHLDYPRGWMNYAAVYGRMRVCDRPDHIVILGTNHFGFGTGVVACDKGYETVLGVCKPDTALLSMLRSSLGETLFEHRYDHEREHSIELHIPWIQHIFGKNSSGEYPLVTGIIVHDPVPFSGASYDGKGIALDPFVQALKNAISKLPGKTLVISSADLSHVGPAFGDQKPLAGEGGEAEAERNRVVQHDMQMLEFITKKDVAGLMGSMAWQQNSTRWCSVGNMCAAIQVVEPQQVELLNYAAAIDQQGMAMVSSAAIVMR